MAVYNFANGATIANFDPAVDVLAIDSSVFGSASQFTFNTSGDDLILTAANGQRTTLTGVSVLELTTTNVNFSDNSTLHIGDNTTDVFADANANAGLVDSGNTDSNIWGFEGNDTVVISGNGDNFVQGHAGDDDIDVDGDGANIVRGGSGADSIEIAATAAGNNNVIADAGDDILDVLGEGNNTVNGGAGADDFDVDGTGENFVRGGGDNDNIDINAAATGDNTVWGDLGDDVIDVDGTGDNSVYGDNVRNLTQSGADTITLGATAAGNNMLNGMAGADTLVVNLVAAQAGDNTLRGGADADTFTITDGAAAAGSFLFRGDAGVDTFNLTFDFAAAQDEISLEGGAGDDVFNLAFNAEAHVVNVTDFGGADVANVTLSGGNAASLTVSRAAGFTQIVNAADETIRFTGSSVNFNSTNLVLSDGSVLWTNLGGSATTLTGATSADQLVAGDNGDRLVSGGGADKLVGGTGNDTFVFTGTAATTLSTVTVTGAAGTDVLEVITDAVTLADADFATVTGVERINVLANVTGHSITLGAAANTAGIRTVDLSGVTTNTNTSTINTVGVTAATVIGGAGADTVDVGTGANNVSLGGGNDLLDLDSTTTGTLQGGAGTDTLDLFDAAQTVTLNGTTIGGFEDIDVNNTGAVTLNFTAAYNATVETGVTLVIDSGAGALTVGGSALTVDASVTGGAAADNITTGSGDDTIVSAAAADTISAGAGADVITGGDGADSMTGGAGADTFNFLLPADVSNIITDFTVGAGGDIISLDTSAFGTAGYDADLVTPTTSGAFVVAAADQSGNAIVFTDSSGITSAADAAAIVESANAATTDYVLVFWNDTTDAVEVYFDATSAAGAPILVATLDNLTAADLANFNAANFDTF